MTIKEILMKNGIKEEEINLNFLVKLLNLDIRAINPYINSKLNKYAKNVDFNEIFLKNICSIKDIPYTLEITLNDLLNKIGITDENIQLEIENTFEEICNNTKETLKLDKIFFIQDNQIKNDEYLKHISSETSKNLIYVDLDIEKHEEYLLPNIYEEGNNKESFIFINPSDKLKEKILNDYPEVSIELTQNKLDLFNINLIDRPVQVIYNYIIDMYFTLSEYQGHLRNTFIKMKESTFIKNHIKLVKRLYDLNCETSMKDLFEYLSLKLPVKKGVLRLISELQKETTTELSKEDEDLISYFLNNYEDEKNDFNYIRRVFNDLSVNDKLLNMISTENEFVSNADITPKKVIMIDTLVTLDDEVFASFIKVSIKKTLMYYKENRENILYVITQTPSFKDEICTISVSDYVSLINTSNNTIYLLVNDVDNLSNLNKMFLMKQYYKFIVFSCKDSNNYNKMKLLSISLGEVKNIEKKTSKTVNDIFSSVEKTTKNIFDSSKKIMNGAKIFKKD